MSTTNTDIEWTDATWNPVTGCEKVSPGCDNCYAEGIARRFAGTKAFPNGFAVTTHPQRLEAPKRWRTPRKVFVNSMSDLFHADVPDEFIAAVWDTMAATPRHTYQVLTKRPARMRALMRHLPVLPNVWLGVSVEDQKWAERRVPVLLDTPAAVRFLSCEPLLGPIDLTRAVWTMGSQRGHGLTASFVHTGWCCQRFHGIDWVIVGGESGPGARPMYPDWARGIRDQCIREDVPFLFKQWGAWAPTGWHGIGRGEPGRRIYVGEPVDEHGHREEIARTSKHAAGRILDGRTWDQYPPS